MLNCVFIGGQHRGPLACQVGFGLLTLPCPCTLTPRLQFCRAPTTPAWCSTCSPSRPAAHEQAASRTCAGPSTAVARRLSLAQPQTSVAALKPGGMSNETYSLARMPRNV